MKQDIFQQAKLAVKQAQALDIFDPTLPAELDIHVTQDGFGWGLWQRQSSVRTPIGFWSQVWHRAEYRYSMTVKQFRKGNVLSLKMPGTDGFSKSNLSK